MKPTLMELAAKYSSDKLHWHSYIPAYTSLFEGGHLWRQAPGSDEPGAGPALRSLMYCDWCRYRNDSPSIPPCLNTGIKVERLLEIGIGFKDLMKPFLPAGVEYVHGSSLKMWEEYFPEAQIFACDIREDTLINEGRIRSVVCDQAEYPSLQHMQLEFGPEPFDLIIDDGSHVPDHQWFTAGHLLPRLSKGGVYVVEDVWDNNDGSTLANVYKGELWRGEKGRDDNLVVVRR